MGLDLYGDRIESQPEAVLDEVPGDGLPRHIGIHDEVGVVVAHRPVELAEIFTVKDLVELAPPAGDEHGEFLAHCGGRGGLPVGVAEHRDVRRFAGEGGRDGDQVLAPGQPLLLDPVPEHEGVGKVVDVFGSTTEMDRFGDVLHGGPGNGFPYVVLHRLNVMAGLPLDFLDPLGLRVGEIQDQRPQETGLFLGKGAHVPDLGPLRHGDQPFDLHVQPVLDQRPFGEIGGKALQPVAVSAVQGR